MARDAGHSAPTDANVAVDEGGDVAAANCSRHGREVDGGVDFTTEFANTANGVVLTVV